MKKTIIEIAQSRGSSAKTKAGAWKYLLAHLPAPHPGLKMIGTGRTRTPGHCPAPYSRDAKALADYQQMVTERRATRIAAAIGHPLQSEQWDWYCEAYEMHREYTRRCTAQLGRDGYGAVTCITGLAAPGPYNAAYWQAVDLIAQARKTDLIEAAYDSIKFDNKRRAEGEAVHHEMYDFSPGAAIVCVRKTEGTRYGVKTLSKTYYLVEQAEETVLCSLITKPVARYAKKVNFGEVIAIVRGEMKFSPALETVPGYKLLQINDDGSIASVWDGSSWAIGKRRTEAAKDDHCGGLYYYRDLTRCLEAAHENSVFHPSMQHRKLAVLKVETSGRQVSYYTGKFAATHITPVEVIAMTL
ncbi:MAG: hypothetical protein AB9919_06850 [Geobacteraceae bacterium]